MARTKAAHQKRAAPWFMWGLIISFQVYIPDITARRAVLLPKSLFMASTTLTRRAQRGKNPALVLVQTLTPDGGMDGRRKRTMRLPAMLRTAMLLRCSSSPRPMQWRLHP
jgi:hypothetical protein